MRRGASVSVTALLASLLLVGILAYLYTSRLPPFNMPRDVSVAPLDAFATLHVECVTDTLAYEDIQYPLIVGFNASMELSLKSHAASTIRVDKIIYRGNNTYASFWIDPPVNVPPNAHVLVNATGNWTMNIIIPGGAVPGDVLRLEGGALIKTVHGDLAVYAGELPSELPSDYVCPFTSRKIYTPTVRGEYMESDMTEPGCAPILLKESFGTYSGNLFVVTAFRVLNYKYPEYDMPFYLHVYSREGDNAGFLAREIGLSFNENFMGGADVDVDPTSSLVYAAYYLDRVTGLQYVYLNDNKDVACIGEAGISSGPMSVVIGLARERKAPPPAIYLALVIDSSLSMRDDWADLEKGLRSAIDLLSEKNVHIAVMDFVDKRVCSIIGDCDFHARIWTDFTADYEYVVDTVLPSVSNFEGSIELSSYAIWKALSQLSWSTSPDDAKVILLASDERLQEGGGVTKEEAVELAVEKGVQIFVARTELAHTLDYYAENTGGKVYLIGSERDLGEALIELIEGIELEPAILQSRVPFIGVYGDKVIRITGLYPGDKVYIVHPVTGKFYVKEAETDKVEIDVTQYYTPRELVVALLHGGFKILVQVDPTRALSALPSFALLHYTTVSHDEWYPIKVTVKSHCKLPFAARTIKVTRVGEVYRVDAFVRGAGWVKIGVYPRLELEVPYGTYVSIIYDDGTRAHGYVGNGFIVPHINFEPYVSFSMYFIGKKISYVYGGRVIFDTKEFTVLEVNGVLTTGTLHLCK